ncbi:unnamed protein product [Symbiodinium natans]|uniref:Uncharacterized protein n=1 Tax=Symbiodinium natans TaxID=878477 RepID=A0A812HA56_9DINO|nr:unnamed protein product [Symbiodinium natans]
MAANSCDHEEVTSSSAYIPQWWQTSLTRQPRSDQPQVNPAVTGNEHVYITADQLLECLRQLGHESDPLGANPQPTGSASTTPESSSSQQTAQFREMLGAWIQTVTQRLCELQDRVQELENRHQ